MTTQPLLRVYRESPPEAAMSACDKIRGPASVVHPVAAAIFSAVVHFVVLGGASIAATLVVSNGVSSWRGVPDHPLHTVFVALVLAQCGLGSVFLARCSWSLYIKALAALLMLGGLWLLLIGTMETTRQSPVAAGAWAACLVVEAVVVWTLVTFIELAVHYEPAAARSRFGLLHLLICTTLVAICFGGGRVLAARYGFALKDVPDWDFFWHIQAAAVTNAALAVGMFASLHLPRTWTARATWCCALLIVAAFAAPLVFLAVFSKNESLTEMRWLFGSEGLFLIATLVPMEILREEYERISRDVAHPNSGGPSKITS